METFKKYFHSNGEEGGQGKGVPLLFYDVILLFKSVQVGGGVWKSTNSKVSYMCMSLYSPLKFGICDISYAIFYTKFNIFYINSIQ